MILINFFCILVQLLFVWLNLSVGSSYPKGLRELHRNDDQSSEEILISTTFPFFDKSFDSLFVNTNGAISFSTPVSQYTPGRFPLGDGRVLIAPFWADVDIRRQGSVLYGAYTSQEVLTKASQDIRNVWPKKFSKFSATWVFVTTWDKVPFYGSTNQTTTTNTFQSILITNGRYSFVRFNYSKITWTTGTASQGNSSGLGGVEAECGFNAVDGNTSYSITGSGNIRVLDLPLETNVNIKGVFIFRTDQATIEEGGCNTKGFLTFTAYDYKVIMLGGRNIEVRGPCFKKTDNIVCKFDNGKQSPGAYVDESTARCTPPLVNFIGKAKLFLSRDNGKTFPYDGTFYYVSQEEKTSLVTTKWECLLNRCTNTLKISWPIASLQSLEDDVVIEIARYVISNGEVKLLAFHTVEKRLKGYSTGSLSYTLPVVLLEKEVEGERDIEEGRFVSFLRVRKRILFKSQAESSYEWLWSKVLMWHTISESNSAKRCKRWQEKEPNPMHYQDDPTLISCPPWKDKADEDDGRYNEYSKSKDSFFTEMDRKENHKIYTTYCFRTSSPRYTAV